MWVRLRVSPSPNTFSRVYLSGATNLVFHSPRPVCMFTYCCLRVLTYCCLRVFTLCTVPCGTFSESRLLTPSLAVGANLWVRLRSSADFVTGSLVGWPPLNILVELGTVLS